MRLYNFVSFRLGNKCWKAVQPPCHTGKYQTFEILTELASGMIGNVWEPSSVSFSPGPSFSMVGSACHQQEWAYFPLNLSQLEEAASFEPGPFSWKEEAYHSALTHEQTDKHK